MRKLPMNTPILNSLSGPESVRKLSYENLEALAKEIRYTLISTVSKTGGHLASNLGVVELTLAMHKTFSSPKDSFIWDVGHQVYTHKLLTGRADRFSTIRQNGGLSGFPNPEESEHDVFAAGHSGTSVASAYGLARAKKLNGDHSYTVAVIGDGSFSGGLVYEALNNAGYENTNLIVVLNENEMSISKNVGAMARYLTKIRTKPQYYYMKSNIRERLEQVPVVGPSAVKFVVSAKKRVKGAMYASTMFEDMGFAYMGPIDGHDIPSLCLALEAAKSIEEPVLLHIKTVKGKGYEFAEENPDRFHGISNFNLDTGERNSSGTDFSAEFGKELVALAKEDPSICAITAAMGLGTGLEPFAEQFPDRYFDVGIAEEFGATFAGGLAKGGKIPVYAIYSTFLQRAYDEISHDVAMQNQKVVFAIDRAGLVGEDGRSHQGIFDVAFLRTIPNTVIYSPASYEGVSLYLRRAIYEDGNVVALRYPRGKEGYLPKGFRTSGKDYDIYGNTDAKVALVTYGRLFSHAAQAVDELGADVKIIKLNRVWPIHPDVIKEAASCKEVLFYEEGCKSGGIGESFALELLKAESNAKYSHYAIDNTYVHHAPVEVLLEEFRLDKDSMKAELKKRVENIE